MGTEDFKTKYDDKIEQLYKIEGEHYFYEKVN